LYSERAALTKRHSVRLYAEELALARCNKSFEVRERESERESEREKERVRERE
jgi:tmRNA-binding protein